MEKIPTVGESVCVDHGHGASLAKIITATKDKIRIRYESWMPHDTGEPEFDVAPEELSPNNETVPWLISRDRIVLPSPQLLDQFLDARRETR